jgi:cyclophilin family peptidyl-prolyl cis-trans isomerase
MSHGRKYIVMRREALRWLGLLSLVAVVGCGHGGDGNKPPAAAIGTQAGSSPTTGGSPGTSAQKPPSDPQHPVVQLETSLGSIKIRLDAEKAPGTVFNFLSYVTAGHYDQTIVHQVYKGQGFLAGGYGVNLVEKPTRTPIRNEADNGLKNRKGTISMVRRPDSADSATCQFFINMADNPNLDFKAKTTAAGYGYCVFGEVVEGLDVVNAIGNVRVCDTKDFECTPEQAVVVKTIRQIR